MTTQSGRPPERSRLQVVEAEILFLQEMALASYNIEDISLSNLCDYGFCPIVPSEYG